MLQSLFSMFFPARCIGCKASGRPICAICERTITRALPPDISWIKAFYNYQNPLIKKIIKNAKYNHKSEALLYLAESIKNETLAHIEKHAKTRAIVVVPIPQHISKTRARGFNQAEKIAQAIFSAPSNLPIQLDSNLLTKIRATKPQAQIHTRNMRLQNTKSSMQAIRACDPNTLYIVVDDVLTTGGTMIEARRALSETGAKHILGITIAH